MSEVFKIYIDRLKGEAVHKIDALIDPSFLDVNEPELQFKSPVKVDGEAYLTDEHLVIHLKASTLALMPCAICNQLIQTKLAVADFYHAETIQEIRSAIFDFSEALREALLVELPHVVECNEGKCPERSSIASYTRSEARSEKSTHFPFTDMEL